MFQAEYPENLRNNAENMLNSSLPLLLQLYSDRQTDVPLAINSFVTDLLRVASLPQARLLRC